MNRTEKQRKRKTLMTERATCLAVATVVVVGLAGQVKSQEYAWKQVGPGGGGRFQTPAISPHDDRLLFCSNDMSSSYRSTDGGASWTLIPYAEEGLTGVSRWVFHPTDTGVVFAYSRGAVFRSGDQGEHWEPLEERFPSNVVFSRRRSGIGMGILENELFLTRDAGESWQPAGGKLREDAGRVIDIVFGGKDEEVFIGTKHGVFRSENDGRAWTECTAGLDHEGEQLTLVGFAGGNDGAKALLYVTVPTHERKGKLIGGVYRSADGGRSWQPVGQEGLWLFKEDDRLPQYQRLAVSTDNPDVVFVTMAGVQSSEVTRTESTSPLSRLCGRDRVAESGKQATAVRRGTRSSTWPAWR